MVLKSLNNEYRKIERNIDNVQILLWFKQQKRLYESKMIKSVNKYNTTRKNEKLKQKYKEDSITYKKYILALQFTINVIEKGGI